MFLFSFAAFLLPSPLYSSSALPSSFAGLSIAESFSDANLFSSIQKLQHSSSPAPLSETSSNIFMNRRHFGNSISKTTILPLEPHFFFKSLSTLSKINPPNAVLGIEGLFKSIKSEPLDVKLAIVPPTSISSLSKTQNLDSSKEFIFDVQSCLNEASLIVDPSIKIAPYVSFEDDSVPSQHLRLSIYTDIVSVPDSGQGDGGILKLDLQVFAASWLSREK